MLNVTAHILGLLQAFSFMSEAVLTCLVVPSYPFRFRNATLENRIEVLGTWSGDFCWPDGLLHEGGRGAGQPLHPCPLVEFLPEPFLLRGTLLRPLREKPQAAGVTAAGQRGGAEGSRVRSEVSTPVPQPSPAPCPAFPARKPLGFGSLKNQPPVSVGCGAWQQATRCVPPEPQAPVLQSGHGFLSPSISQQSSIFFIFYFLRIL